MPAQLSPGPGNAKSLEIEALRAPLMPISLSWGSAIPSGSGMRLTGETRLGGLSTVSDGMLYQDMNRI